MAHSGLPKLICILLISAIVTAAAVPCGTVQSRVTPCIGYVQSGGVVPPSCCDGIKALYASRSTPDLQSICGCLKTIIPSVKGNPTLVNSVPPKCGVKFPYKYTPSIDCSKVHW
ncbi:non-specific lipid-transfer protein [Acinetobacter baumannii]